MCRFFLTHGALGPVLLSHAQVPRERDGALPLGPRGGRQVLLWLPSRPKPLARRSAGPMVASLGTWAVVWPT